MISLFGSTYCCEQFFSKIRLFKTKCRNQLIDGHLSRLLRVATSSVKADIDKTHKIKDFIYLNNILVLHAN